MIKTPTGYWWWKSCSLNSKWNQMDNFLSWGSNERMSRRRPGYRGRGSHCRLVQRRLDSSCKNKQVLKMFFFSQLFFSQLFRPIFQVEACGICKDPLLQVFLRHLKTEVSKLDLSEPVDPLYFITSNLWSPCIVKGQSETKSCVGMFPLPHWVDQPSNPMRF